MNVEIHGNGGDDVIMGVRGLANSHLYGEDGNDTIIGYGSENWIYGGTGNDRIEGRGALWDVVSGDDGNDTINGGAGTNTEIFHAATGRSLKPCHFALKTNPASVQFPRSRILRLPASMQTRLMNRLPGGIGTEKRGNLLSCLFGQLNRWNIRNAHK